MRRIGPQAPVIHLYRGAPAVRAWSKYQVTVKAWTLCGIDRHITQRDAGKSRNECVEDPALVTCRFCRVLIRTGDRARRRR
jgi:hypothetical protein